ncbi:MAG TPA: epoxide hydrolase [Nocardioides sp.]|nr:epoxide hydrolase [Nocardioides sp.]HRK44235.1 epoxide hydrolase [Nocardioides sp.]
MREFRIAVDETALEDLRLRLSRTRFPDQLPEGGWGYGFDAEYLRELCRYWRDEFDWRSVERTLNSFDHALTVVDDERIQFIHQRSARQDAIPLLMLHGWPGTVLEFHKVIRGLTDPDPGKPAFHVVAPSLPGFAWSGPTRSHGWNPRRMAASFAILMSRLGYRRYGIQGTDWGSIIGTELALGQPDAVSGLHINMVLVRPPENGAGPVTNAERLSLEREAAWHAEEMGYDVIQSTKPQTLAAALADSPAGLAAWMVDKYRSWSDCHGDVETRFTRDELLATVTTYWVTQTVASSMRLYLEHSKMTPRYGCDGLRVEVPTACAIFPVELYHPPRSWVDARYNVVRWTDFPEGGHFPALEEPEALLSDVRAFFGAVRP